MAYPNYYRSRYAPDEEIDPNEYASGRPSLASLLPKPDPELDERWRGAENQALTRSQQGGSYGPAEGVRDFAPMAIGGLLDILVNKGQGLGTLAAGGMQALSSENSRRDAAQKSSAAQALAIKQQRESGADRTTNAYHAILRGEELRNRMDEDLAKRGTPEEQQARREADLAEVNARTGKLNADAKNSGLDDIIRYMGILGTQEGNAARLALAERVAKQKEEATKLKAEELARDKANAATADREKTRTRNGQTFNRMGKDVLAQAQVLQSIEPMLLKYGNRERPGIGPVDARAPTWMAPLLGGNEEDGIVFRQAQARLFGWASHEVTGATSAEREREYNQIAQGLRPGGTEKEVTAGLNAARKALRSKIRGLAKPDEEAAREVLRENGLEDWVYGPDLEYGGKPASSGPTLGPGEGGPQSPHLGPSDMPPLAPTDGTPVRGGSWPGRAPATPPPSPEADKPATSGPAQLTAAEQQELQALMGKVPPEQFDSFSDRMLSMQPRQQLEFLRGLMGKQPAPPAARPARPARPAAQPKAAPSPKGGALDKAKRRGWMQ